MGAESKTNRGMHVVFNVKQPTSRSYCGDNRA